MKDRTFNTLFMITSLDGKISTGDVDDRDIDKDFKKIKVLQEGRYQYDALEKRTDIHSFNTGRVMAKIGMNTKKDIKRIPVNFIIVDNKPHLNKQGVLNMLKWCKKLYLVTTNKNHPAFNINSHELEIIYYTKLNLQELFKKLHKKYGIKRVTIQSGGEMNALLVREGLIDSVSIVIAPTLIGGRTTSTLMDGDALRSENDLKLIKVLKLEKVNKLKNSYIHVIYKVVN